MEFHYYYIIQDIIGVLMSFIGIRMLTLTIRMILTRKKSKKSIMIVIGYTLITISGLNLLCNSFGLKHWVVSIILVFLSILIIKLTINSIKS